LSSVFDLQQRYRYIRKRVAQLTRSPHHYNNIKSKGVSQYQTTQKKSRSSDPPSM